MKWICEWCEPSSIPEKDPSRCKVVYCGKCGVRTWHWPYEKLRPPLRHPARRTDEEKGSGVDVLDRQGEK